MSSSKSNNGRGGRGRDGRRGGGGNWNQEDDQLQRDPNDSRSRNRTYRGRGGDRDREPRSESYGGYKDRRGEERPWARVNRGQYSESYGKDRSEPRPSSVAGEEAQMPSTHSSDGYVQPPPYLMYPGQIASGGQHMIAPHAMLVPNISETQTVLAEVRRYISDSNDQTSRCLNELKAIVTEEFGKIAVHQHQWMNEFGTSLANLTNELGKMQENVVKAQSESNKNLLGEVSHIVIELKTGFKAVNGNLASINDQIIKNRGALHRVVTGEFADRVAGLINVYTTFDNGNADELRTALLVNIDGNVAAKSNDGLIAQDVRGKFNLMDESIDKIGGDVIRIDTVKESQSSESAVEVAGKCTTPEKLDTFTMPEISGPCEGTEAGVTMEKSNGEMETGPVVVPLSDTEDESVFASVVSDIIDKINEKFDAIACGDDQEPREEKATA